MFVHSWATAGRYNTGGGGDQMGLCHHAFTLLVKIQEEQFPVKCSNLVDETFDIRAELRGKGVPQVSGGSPLLFHSF